MNTMAIDTLTLVVLGTLTVATPLLGIWDFNRLQRWVAAGRADARTRFYTWVLAMEWSLTAVFGIWWLMEGRGLSQLRMLPAAGGWQWLAIGLGLAGSVFLLWQMFSVLGNKEELGKLRGKIGGLEGMVPTTRGEGRFFDVVSVTAGVCEEFIYRGILLVTLTAVVGLWPAVALSSVIFGLGHAYQGGGGIVKTSIVGLLMALLTVFSGSLFIPMLLHAVIDLTSGRMMAAALKVAPVEPEGQTA